MTDDGRGIDEGVATSGIRNMPERAEALGGTCDVRRRTGGGTVLRWSVPVA